MLRISPKCLQTGNKVPTKWRFQFTKRYFFHFYPTDLVNAKTTIPLWSVNSTRYIHRRFVSLYTAISRKVVGKVHVTIPKGIVGSFEFTFLQRNLNKWHERPLEYVCES